MYEYIEKLTNISELFISKEYNNVDYVCQTESTFSCQTSCTFTILYLLLNLIYRSVMHLFGQNITLSI